MLRMKSVRIVLLVSLCALGMVTRANATDGRLMTDAEYKSFLNDVESKLPAWEGALKKIDPAKSEASYSIGDQIGQARDLALMLVGYARQAVAKQRVKRTVSGELALETFIKGVFDSMQSIVMLEISAGLTLSTLETFAHHTGELDGLISNDVIARVELLEKATCP
jgi:hypothetical protein